ncbi:hypothetical protein M9H77_22483 [Catharanthus roseus]|uniref:Uncharacterized protein n=1 Tax=Catharanthus roseus TaxID=4058 RepID=A0ACC0AQL1_CATRO|nr:hypothetical protein M9H77_22483 [Catharanthus roseus]
MQILVEVEMLKKEEAAEEEQEKERGFIFVKEAANFEEWTRKRRKIAPSHRVDLNDMEETPQDSIRFYTKNKKCYDANLYSERRFEEIFTKGEVLRRHDDRNVNKLDAYDRLLHHMISNIIIPNVGHKSSITNMHSFVMLALHKYRRMNFDFMAIEHMLATQSSSTKFGDHIGPGKIYNKHTFKRMGFERNEEGMLVRGRQDKNEEQEEMNVEKDESEEEPGEEAHRREMRRKNRQERTEEGQSSVDMTQLMARIITMQSQLNSRLDDIDGNIFGVSRLHYIEAKDLGDQGIMKKKRLSH